MHDNMIGYTKEEYYQISAKHGLPNRCPILRNCHRAFKTRYEMCVGFSTNYISFEIFLQSISETRSPDALIKSIESGPTSLVNGAITAVKNVCPEIMLFEPDYLPHDFMQAAFGNASYYNDTRRFQAEPKHYRECTEFAEFSYIQKHRNKLDTNVLNLTSQIPEKALEDYLENNLEKLEPGLKFLNRQKQIGKWIADIIASDSNGFEVLIELKSKVLNRADTDRLIGQVSRYYHRASSTKRELRVFIVIPKAGDDILDSLYHGLKSWIESNKVTVYQFDFSLYARDFTFSKLNFQ